MGARMLHPSSERNNFNVVFEKPKSSNNKKQTSIIIKQEPNVTQLDHKIEIETKTKDAIKSQSLTSSNNFTTTDKN
ncbi:unnamed protein product [Rotaria sordida]|uniref:Uncharacterized protein n=1 Tax=Rotaria sordida TaxID=392033 RepID=A0A814S154_9BILA|nr:unnamed protein product [Rotaria sordida]